MHAQNGIVNVAARDKATGKQQNVTIQSSGGLSDDQIQRMVREAEQFASADAARKEAIEAKNEADTLLYSAERNLSEHKSKLPADVVTGIETAMADLRGVMDGQESQAIKDKINALQQQLMKIGTALNQQASSSDSSNSGSDKDGESAAGGKQ